MPGQTTNTRRWKRLALAATFAAAAVLGSVAIASPASADTLPEHCTFGSSSGNVKTCVQLSLSGITLTTSASATVTSQGRKLQLCINTPFGVKCTPGFQLVTPGHSLFLEQNGNNPQSVPNGYCVNTWRQNASGPPTRIGHICTSI